MPLINSDLILFWLGQQIVIVYTNVANQRAAFEITETKYYVPVVILSTQDYAKLLHQLMAALKRIIDWNKYLPKPELLAHTPNLNHLVEPSFQGVNRLFALTF